LKGSYLSIEKAIDDVKLVCDGFEAIMHELDAVLEKNIWLSYGVLKDAYETITDKIPSLTDFQQRLIKLKEINAHLSVQ